MLYPLDFIPGWCVWSLKKQNKKQPTTTRCRDGQNEFVLLVERAACCISPWTLEYTAPVQQWFHTGCSNETFWQEALLTQSYCHLNCLLLTKHAHQHYPQNISAASSVTKISAQKEFQKGSNPKTITMIKGHWMGNLRNQKRLFMNCSSFLPAKSLTAFWLNSHGPQITFMLHLFWLRKQILK